MWSKLTKYLMGTAFVAGGLAVTLFKLGVSSLWISIVILLIVGLGIKFAWSNTGRNAKSGAVK